ncbi:ubiquinone/menaquinone biosynthesis methyltransferase [Methylacidiphilum caldifontis]|uniref:Demethylmenaquinone methyltransferase n=1 Tax=Methylacidiphilum caldifontis TaxID=2795386 RepID=A0A4Y8PH86_9BACT|nr:ubiquinone/menaquinone biosynthesis methyltransferase [Methylacidiphilum caldifontis]QSR88941.1 ubiquinone/menaquinone biosynthesis methyltransferase [Methylacidiphilum caldifontis]TFE71814.1 ubiquinone biosynthesis protein [Methylacidiphilum caldifontis]
MPQQDYPIEKLFDKVAYKYDFLNHLLSFGIDLMWRRKLAKKIAALNPLSLLDLATGSGDMLRAILKRCPSLHTYYGVDISEEMLVLAKLKGLHNLLVADASQLPFAESSFDVATIAFGLRNFQHRLLSLKEIFRVLRPGGSLYVLEFSMPKAVIKPFYLFYLLKVVPWLAALVGAPKEAYIYLAESIIKFPPALEVVALFRKAGFNPCGFFPMTLGIVTVHWGKKP